MGNENSTPAPAKQPSPALSDRVSSLLTTALCWFEIVLAACTSIVVLIGAVHLFTLLVQQGMPNKLSEFSTRFEDILSAVLLLVVGVSLAIMLVMRKPEHVVQIMFFVIARKILITTRDTYELLLAVAALAALFAVRKYLMAKPPERAGAEKDA